MWRWVLFCRKNKGTDDFFGVRRWYGGQLDVFFATMLSSLTFTGLPERPMPLTGLLYSHMMIPVVALWLSCCFTLYRNIDATSAVSKLENIQPKRDGLGVVSLLCSHF